MSKSRKKPRVIQKNPCEHCGGTGERYVAVDIVRVGDAIDAILNFRKRTGKIMAGDLDVEVTVLGMSGLLPDLELSDDSRDLYARDFKLGAWQMECGSAKAWRSNWNLFSLLQNRLVEYESSAARRSELQALSQSPPSSSNPVSR